MRREAEQRVAALRSAAGDAGLQVLDLGAADIRERGMPDLRTASLFGDRRAVVLRDAQDLPADAAALLVQLLDEGAEGVTVLALATGVVRIQALAKRAKEAGGRIDVAPPREWEDRAWADLVRAEFGRHGHRASPDAIAALIGHAGFDVAVIAEKVAQVAAAASEPAGVIIAAEAVERVTVGHGSRGTFAVADALCARDPARALALLRGTLEAGDDPVLVLGALVYRLRSLVAVAGKLDLRAIGLTLSPGQVRRLQGIRRNFGPGELTRAYGLLADADRIIKGGEVPPAFALERAVVLAATRAPQAA